MSESTHANTCIIDDENDAHQSDICESLSEDVHTNIRRKTMTRKHPKVNFARSATKKDMGDLEILSQIVSVIEVS